MHVFYFEKMQVWKDSKELVIKLYKITKSFPETEKFGMVFQIRRASVSVPTNIAEGSGRSTKKDQANYTTMAYTSLMEVLNLLILAHELEFLSQENYLDARKKITEIANKLNALKKAQTKNSSGEN